MLVLIKTNLKKRIFSKYKAPKKGLLSFKTDHKKVLATNPPAGLSVWRLHADTVLSGYSNSLPQSKDVRVF